MVAIMATCTASQEEAQRPNTILTSQSSQVCYARALQKASILSAPSSCGDMPGLLVE